MGWHNLVWSITTPVTVAMMRNVQIAKDQSGQLSMQISEGSVAVPVMLILTAGVWFWLLANYVAELHRFQNVWGVFGVAIGLPIAMFVVIGAVAGAAAPMP